VRALLVAAVLVGLLGGGARAETSAAVRGFGIAVTPPAGWHVRISRGLVEASTAPLPPRGRWAAARLSRSIHRGDVELVLFEDRPTPNVPFTRSAYRRGPPLPFRTSEFRGPPLGGSNPGRHGFARRNFRVGGRFFDLFAESGHAPPRAAAVASLNTIVASLRFDRESPYRGRVRAAAFRAAAGWTVVRSGATALAPETVTTTIASTVPYRDGLRDFPPHRTLARLPSDGIVVIVDLVASNRDPPIAAAGEPVRVRACGSFEGTPPTVAVCPLGGLANRRYAIDGWVVYGRRDPTAAMRARARAELRRLVLPRWPLWR
jgi:hypothetical protein